MNLINKMKDDKKEDKKEDKNEDKKKEKKEDNEIQYYGIKKVNNFILFKELGHGAFGKVYLSLDKNLDVLTAIKVINRKFLSQLQKNKLISQLEILSKLNHKNVTKIIDKQKTANNFYIEMEFSNGPNLFEFLTLYKQKFGKNLSESEVQKVVKQIASGLEHLHDNKIIHRDIKLENLIINFDDISNKVKGLTEEDINQKQKIFSTKTGNTSEVGSLIDENITIKICDFGFSREVDNNFQASTILGTPITTAPDVLFLENGQGHYGTEADMWSLGICVYELLIGKPPFINSKEKLKKDILKGEFGYPTNVDISYETISFINSLLQYDAKKRLSWDKFWKHPFLTKDPKNFNPLKLQLNLDDKVIEKLNNFKVDSKNYNNFLWMVYKDGSKVGVDLDKIDNNYMKKEFKENDSNEEEDDDKEEEENEEEEEEEENKKSIINKEDYSFIDLTGKNQKVKVPEDFEIVKSFIQETDKDGWTLISEK